MKTMQEAGLLPGFDLRIGLCWRGAGLGLLFASKADGQQTEGMRRFSLTISQSLLISEKSS
jgi:hypothetical protein